MEKSRKTLSEKEIRELALSEDFYKRDTVEVARDLLGKMLVKKVNGNWSGGYIVEAEAYLGDDDPACHAAGEKTNRNRVMFGPPGRAYVYFIYGMYYCFNAVSFNPATQRAGGVLIRALEPIFDVEGMKYRRKKSRLKELTSGPGKICQALNITRNDNGHPLQSGNLLIIDAGFNGIFKIARDTRIGIKLACHLPYRFYLNGNPFVSRMKKVK